MSKSIDSSEQYGIVLGINNVNSETRDGVTGFRIYIAMNAEPVVQSTHLTVVSFYKGVTVNQSWDFTGEGDSLYLSEELIVVRDIKQVLPLYGLEKKL
jgi:hypothetical protein